MDRCNVLRLEENSFSKDPIDRDSMTATCTPPSKRSSNQSQPTNPQKASELVLGSASYVSNPISDPSTKRSTLDSIRALESSRTLEAPCTADSATRPTSVSDPSDTTITHPYNEEPKLNLNPSQTTTNTTGSERRNSSTTQSSIRTSDPPQKIKNAYREKKLESRQKQHMIDNLHDKLRLLRSQAGTHQELLERCETFKRQNQTYELQIEDMREEYLEEQQELGEQLSEFNEEVKKLENIQDENESLEKEIISLKTKFVEMLSRDDVEKKKTNNKVTEEEIVALKLELAKSRERRDKREMQLREMAIQLTKMKH